MKTFLLLAILSYSLLGSEVQLLPTPPEPLPTGALLDCGSCARSNETCNSAQTTGNSICRCDRDCAVYGDCCTDWPGCREPATLTAASAQSLVFQCRSILYLDSNRTDNDCFFDRLFEPSLVPSTREAFWMASECPEDWLTSTEEAAFVEGNCTRGSSSLPPVSDNETGVVYANEYCAVCNGVHVDNIVPWSYRLSCNNVLSNMGSVFVNDLNLTMDNDLTQELIQEYCQPCSFVEPSTGLPARACYLHISSCLSQQELAVLNTDLQNQQRYNDLVQNCTQGPYSFVTESESPSSQPYRNQYCAMCNGIDPTTVNCYEGPDISDMEGNTTSSLDAIVRGSFSLVLDIHRDGINVRSEVITTTVSVTCSSSEIFDPISNACRPTVCPEGNVGVCSFRNATRNTTEAFSCPDGLRPAVLNDTDYTKLGNDTVLLNEEVFDVIGNLEGNPVVCLSPNGSVTVNVTVLYYSYPTGYFLLTNIGCSLSVVGSFLILLTYILFKELRTLPSKILMNLAAAIIVSNLFILIGGPITSRFPSKNLCTSVAIILHMFFLAQFSWMSVMAFEMIRSLRRATKLTPDSKHFKTRLLIVYFVLGWSIPLVITVVSIMVNFTTDNLVLYGELEDGTQGSCWINHLESAVVAFIVPVALSILFNGIAFVCVTVLLCGAWCTESKLDNEKRVPFLRVYVAIFSITGLTWLFGFLAILAGTVWAWYPFIILNTTQGFSIFIVFIFTKKVALLYLKLLHIPWETEAKTSSTSAKQTYNLHTRKNGG